MTSTSTMPSPRMKNPALVLPGVVDAVQAINEVIKKGGVEQATLHLVHLRVSQINGCSFCVDMAARLAKDADEGEVRRLLAVAAWREAPYFTDAERAALALAESVTRLADRPDPVPDEVWEEAARHFDEAGLSALLLEIAMSNLYNRINVPIRQSAGAFTP